MRRSHSGPNLLFCTSSLLKSLTAKRVPVTPLLVDLRIGLRFLPQRGTKYRRLASKAARRIKSIAEKSNTVTSGGAACRNGTFGRSGRDAHFGIVYFYLHICIFFNASGSWARDNTGLPVLSPCGGVLPLPPFNSFFSGSELPIHFFALSY